MKKSSIITTSFFVSLFLILFTSCFQEIFPMKKISSTEDIKGLEFKATLLHNISSTLRKIELLDLNNKKQPDYLLLSYAIELNEYFLDHKKMEIPEVAFFFAATKTKISREKLQLLLETCKLDPINTLKTFKVISEYLKKT